MEANALKTEETKFGYYLKSVREDIDGKIAAHHDLASEMHAISTTINKALLETYKTFIDKGTREHVEYYSQMRREWPSARLSIAL